MFCPDSSDHHDPHWVLVAVYTATNRGPYETDDDASLHETLPVWNEWRCLELPIGRGLFPDMFLAIVRKYQRQTQKHTNASIKNSILNIIVNELNKYIMHHTKNMPQ